MKIMHMNDLHLEFGNPILPNNTENADILILAGDIVLASHIVDQNPKRRKLYRKFFNHISNQFPCVIIIGGNHELYGWRTKDVAEHGHYLDVIRNFLKEWRNIRFLENEYIDLGDTRFFGATFWTNFGRANPLVMEQARIGMNDYNWHYTPEDTLSWHRTSVEKLDHHVQTHKKLVVITHHAPSFKSVHEMYRGDPMNPCYATEFHEYIEDHPSIKLWFHGHMHNNSDYVIGSTRVLNNPYGYHMRETNKGFNKLAFVELEGDPGVTECNEN